MENIASRLDMAMRAAKLTDQIELARQSGVSVYKINRILSNRTKTVDAEDAYKISKACNVPVAWLIAGHDDAGEPVEHAILYKSEADLINTFRRLDADGRAAILAAARVAAHLQDSDASSEK